jgi:transcriptional regulator with XRE-family HTH domain
VGKNEEIADFFIGLIGDNIRVRRKRIGLSLEKLGLEIGLTRMDVHRIEKGYNITLTTLLKISIALGL